MNQLYAIALWLAMQQAPKPTVQKIKLGNGTIDIKMECPPTVKLCVADDGTQLVGGTGYIVQQAPSPKKQAPDDEPMDVPAVIDDATTLTFYDEELAWRSCLMSGGKLRNKLKCTIETWTCSDKSRILLTAEDGTKHCVKFQK